MTKTGNTILITGGGSGIGRALAEQFLKAGNTVIITGRDKAKLSGTVDANPGMIALSLDVNSPESILQFAKEITAQYPALNVVINNAGIMAFEDVKTGETKNAEVIIETNLLGPIRLTAALLAHLQSKPDATVGFVSSGLALVPLSGTPTYCATKAALHSYAQSLRHQLKGTTVKVMEIAPPYVQTELTGAHQASDPNAMPLADYISETMSIIWNNPDSEEVIVERCKFLRDAEKRGDFDKVFATLNP